jgi:hypothetical protein
MDIQTLIAAVVGAVIGVGSTLITDFVRARRNADEKWTETKRLVYVRFLVAVTQAHSRIKVAALGEIDPAEKRKAVSAVFYDDPQKAEAKSILRELAITGPDYINRLANETYQCLRAIRDVLSRPSITADHPEYRAVSKPFWDSLGALQDAMRDDLQPTPPHHRKQLLKAAPAPEVADKP